MARPVTTEAVVLRTFAFGEADRVLHLYTEAGGRVGAVAKGVRRTRSRFGGRLEPLSHVELVLHRGRGELYTVTGASLVHSHDRIRLEGRRLAIGLIGIEAMLRLFIEEERSDRAFLAVTRFLEALDTSPLREDGRAALDPVGLAFQLKLLAVAGFMPHVSSCVGCGATAALVAFVPSAGGGVCSACDTGGLLLGTTGAAGIAALLGAPIAAAPTLGLGDGDLRDALAVVTASYEHHAGFRLRTLGRR